MKAFAILGQSGVIYDYYNTQDEAERALDNLCSDKMRSNRTAYLKQAKPFSNTRVIATANANIDDDFVMGASKLETLYVCKHYWQK